MSDDGRAELGDSAFLTERTRVRQELERAPTNTASPDLAALYQRIGDESRRERMPQMGAGQLGVTILPRLLAVEVLQSWARRYTRFFLDSCPGISVDIAETAELVGSELVANAVTFGGGPAHIAWHPQRVGASLISLSLQNFREVLLVEVADSNSNPPILSSADSGSENGRGLMLVNALSKEWSYSFLPGGGKIVYCFLAKG